MRSPAWRRDHDDMEFIVGVFVGFFISAVVYAIGRAVESRPSWRQRL